MTIRQQFLHIKRQFFPRWDRHDLWRVSACSRRRVHGNCDSQRRVIEIVTQHSDPDERDKLFIHEICHAVADMGHGKKWLGRMEQAASRADTLGRHRLAKLLREEVVAYQEAVGKPEHAYNEIRDALTDNPNLSFAQIKRWLADQYGLLVSESARSSGERRRCFKRRSRKPKSAEP